MYINLGRLQETFEKEKSLSNKEEKALRRLVLSENSLKTQLRRHRPDESEMIEYLQHQLESAVTKKPRAQKPV